MSPLDYSPGYGERSAANPLMAWLWRVERAFERSMASGRAVDDTRLRIFFVLAIFALAFALLGVRATRAALFSHESVGAHGAAAPFSARADLVDRNGRILALDLAHYGLYLDPREVWDDGEIRRRLLPIFPRLSAERLDRALKANRREYLIGGLTPEEKEQVRDLGLPGLSFETEWRRVYPLGAEAEHVIGFSDSGGHGLAGAERALDGDIRAGGVTGQPVPLSIDLRVQGALQNELARAAAEFQTVAAMGLVVDIHTGEVLGMASWPDYDPNAPAAGQASGGAVNRVAASVYELGSVFKLFTIAAGINEGLVTPDTTFDVHTPLKIGDARPIHDYDHGDTTLPLWAVFTHSSNVGAARLGLMEGADRLTRYFRAFGLFHAAPIELAESARPVLAKRFSDLTIANMAFGQAIAVSPLALATGYVAVLNGGEYIPLTIRRQPDGYRPVGRRVISEATSETMLQLMRMNAIDPKGSGKKADDYGLRVGGKTGSAQKVEGGRYGKNNISSFASVFPTDGPLSAKRYLVLITLDGPKATKDTFGFITGGFTAAPVAGRVINRIAPFLDVARNPAPYLPMADKIDALDGEAAVETAQARLWNPHPANAKPAAGPVVGGSSQ